MIYSPCNIFFELCDILLNKPDFLIGEIWFRVRLGRFANEQDADKAVTLLMDDHSTEGWVYHLEDAATIDW